MLKVHCNHKGDLVLALVPCFSTTQEMALCAVAQFSLNIMHGLVFKVGSTFTVVPKGANLVDFVSPRKIYIKKEIFTKGKHLNVGSYKLDLTNLTKDKKIKAPQIIFVFS
jgi:hypothetical protein